jgi:IS30 family transposase
MTNKHLTYKERQLIALYLAHQVSQRTIAKQLGKSPSSICDEIKRNSDKTGYHAVSAQVKSEKRNLECRTQNPLKNQWILNYCIDELRQGWTPEEIAGRLKKENNQCPIICYETIYKYIYAPENRSKRLAQYLVRAHGRRRRKKYNWLPRRGVPNMVSIDDRPEEINNRSQFGHWEIDVVEGMRDTGAIQVVLERKTRLYLGLKIDKINSACGIKAQKQMFSSQPVIGVKSATLDQGKENYRHQELGIPTYFCHPHSPEQKGSIENHNGILRRYIPKKTDFTTFSQLDLDMIIEEINNRPRKCLAYKTPLEAYNYELQCVRKAKCSVSH